MSDFKFQLEIREFENAFGAYKDSQIIIYGTGRMSATLLMHIKGFNIVGVCDRDEKLVGKEFYGVPILSREQAEEVGDILIINTDPTYWDTIYCRIRDWNIPIFYRNGAKAQIIINHNEKHPYWDCNIELLKQEISKHEIISFDIFDTLLCRRVLMPYDIFRIVEMRLREKYADIDFIMLRKKAISLLNCPTIDEIYECIKEISDWDDQKVEEAKKIELETEKALIYPRQVMVDLCNHIMKEKKVYFVSDMYFTENFLNDLLNQNGIQIQSAQIIVSCELRKEKKDGELWEWYKSNLVKDRLALHIGDNLLSDVEQPLRYGINTFYIMSSLEQLKNSSMQAVLPHVESIQASLAIGFFAEKMLNNPFELNKTKGQINFDNNMTAGYILLGNLMYNFSNWLLQETEKSKVEQIIFFAREGYLLLPEYLHMCKLLKKEKFPEALYLEISRRAIWGATITSVEDLYEIATFPFSGNAYEFLKFRFGVNIEEQYLLDIDVESLQRNIPELHNFLNKYKDIILESLMRERNNYEKYIDGLNIKENVAVVDSILYGTTQYYFQKFIKHKITGYYFCAYQDPENKYYTGDNMKGCFQKPEDTSGKECAMVHNSKFSEAFFTAPNGMLCYIDENGNPCYSKDMSNQKYFSVRNIMQEGVFSYFEKMVELENELGFKNMIIDPVFADVFFGCMMKRGILPTDEMKKSFFFDNKILNNKESKIWN